jgi:membrane-associated phospholipid phosphatase
MIGYFSGLDLRLLLEVNRASDSTLIASFMGALSDFSMWALPLGILALFLALWGRVPREFHAFGGLAGRLVSVDSRLVLVALVCAAGVSDLSSNLIKHAVHRQRPCRDPEVSEQVVNRIHVSGNRSFPSSHAANSASLATVASLAYPPLAVPAAALAFLVGTSRVYGGVHYPSDVAAGWVLGMISGGAVWAAIKRKASIGDVVGYSRRFRKRAGRRFSQPEEQFDPFPFRSVDGWECEGFLHRKGSDLAVLVHGLHEDVGMMTPVEKFFTVRGYSVLLVPLRGHDNHPCQKTSGGPEEAMDLAGALLAAEAFGFPADQTVIYGDSMGAAVAIKASCLLAAKPVRGVIAHGCYTSFFESARMKLGAWRAAVLQTILPGPVRRSLLEFSPLNYLPLAPGTLGFAFLNGSRDSVCPPEMGSSLMSACRKGIHLVLGGAGHPKWSEPERQSDWQFEKAMDCALEFLKTEGDRRASVFVDEDGVVRDVRGPREATSGRSAR